jgi:hypothetical protein
MPEVSFQEKEVYNFKIRYSFVSRGHFKLKMILRPFLH